MKAIKGLVLLILSYLTVSVTFAAESHRDAMKVGGGKFSAMESTDVSIKDNFLKTIQVYLVSAYGIIAVGVLIFIGFRLFSARGNEAEFKQAWIALAYTVVGLAIAPLAFAIIRIVTGFTLS
ncbi:MAG: hypothetical protein ACOYN2_01325 [Patescibacteria group bacterium]